MKERTGVVKVEKLRPVIDEDGWATREATIWLDNGIYTVQLVSSHSSDIRLICMTKGEYQLVKEETDIRVEGRITGFLK